VPASKLERLVNLLLMLLAARRPVTAEQIRAVVPGYEQADDESFRRMFERDKEELRDLGVPVETQPLDAWEDEVGYRIVRATYELPAIELAADEAAAVALAARLWQSAGLADASASALLKLRAAGVEADPVATAGIEPRVAAREAAFDPLLAAVRAARAVTFAYRPSYADEPVPRTVEPWGLVHRHGRWYVVGHDRDREATRVFKLSRISGDVTPVGVAGAFTVPAGVDLQAAVAPEETPTKTAVVRVAPDAAYDVRRAATSLAEDSDGWTRAEVPYGDLDRFAEWVVGFGADAVVVEPADARAAVVERLRALVAR
jgi:predicted DNA-binding transcriptional regulator YafY